MIKFFRKIRQNLLIENKTRKYFKYAIGEIILVVIGILIALQINNWNENNKQKTKEKAILENLRTSLENDISTHHFHIQVYEEAKSSIQFLIEFIEKDYQYQDSLKYHFGRTTHLWNPSIRLEIFENLKSIGFDIVSNKDLKQEILRYYSYANTDFVTSKNRYDDIITNANSNIFNTRFKAFWNGNYDLFRKTGIPNDLEIEMIPNDFESLKKDDEYLFFLRSLKNQHYWFAERNNLNAKKIAENLLLMVNQELEKNKND
ncbi:DUF6090 family protein [Algibacter sp. 2305UL17-15]|uniref:DUF6090 family protein n=1 Tax=Algibacter sp. 2305UL17-15 TaxID=3231268 RepID=UPI003459E26C